MKRKKKDKGSAIFMTICWSFITLMHGLTYGIMAGIMMGLASIIIIGNSWRR